MFHLYKNIFPILLLLTCYLNAHAQNNSKKEIELQNYFWKESGADFKVSEAPEKWKEKPAIIIARSFEKHYKKRRVGGLEYFDYEHHRIKLQSKQALEDYAEFTFPENTTFGTYGVKFYAGYKIIKPNGKEIEISIDKAVVSEMKVNRLELNMRKLAIPNLEVGDIVDFYIAEEQHLPPVSNYYSFDPTIYTLVAQYPVMKQKITFDVERKCYLNAKSLNGAPEFKRKNKGDDYFYVLEDEDRENYEDSNWMYPYRQLPTIKFKVVYAKGAITASPFFLGQQGVLKNKVDQKEVVDFVNAYLNDYTSAAAVYYQKLKKQFKGRTDKEAIAKEIYYELRNKNIISNVEAFIQNGRDQNQDYNNYFFVSTLKYLYDKLDIKNKVIVGAPRNISTIENIILENEIIIALKVNDKFILGDFDNYSTFGEYPYLLEDTDVYEFDNIFFIKTGSFEASNANDNNITKELNFSITDLENDESAVDIKSSISGHHKKEYQYKLLDFYDYKDEEAVKYKMKPYSNAAKKNAHAKYLQKKETYISDMQKEKLENLKALAELNYDLTIKEVKDFVVTANGRYNAKPAFEYIYKTNFEGLVKKAGNDFLVSVGKLIENQINLEKDELERDYDIYMPFARSYNHKIIFNIPAGYGLEGVENLNVDVTTDFGGFISTAKVNSENQLLVETRKYYSSNFVAKENWDEMKTFLKAAEDFNRKNVLLKAK